MKSHLSKLKDHHTHHLNQWMSNMETQAALHILSLNVSEVCSGGSIIGELHSHTVCSNHPNECLAGERVLSRSALVFVMMHSTFFPAGKEVCIVSL